MSLESLIIELENKEDPSSSTLSSLRCLYAMRSQTALNNDQETSSLSLRSLRLSDKDFVDIFNEFEQIESVQSLDLANNQLTLQAVLFALKKNLFPNLKHLDIPYNFIGWTQPTGYQIAQLNALESPSLTRLNLRSNKIAPTGASLLSQMYLPKLEDIDISECHLQEDGLIKLLQSKSIQPTFLDISSNELTDKSLKILVESPFASNITSLKLSNNRFTPKGLYPLSYLHSLRHLSLSFTTLGQESIARVLSSVTLNTLTLDRCEIDTETTTAITTFGCFLDTLSLENSDISDDNLESIKFSLPETEVII